MAFKEKQELLISEMLAATISFRAVLIIGHKSKINWGWGGANHLINCVRNKETDSIISDFRRN